MHSTYIAILLACLGRLPKVSDPLPPSLRFSGLLPSPRRPPHCSPPRGFAGSAREALTAANQAGRPTLPRPLRPTRGEGHRLTEPPYPQHNYCSFFSPKSSIGLFSDSFQRTSCGGSFKKAKKQRTSFGQLPQLPTWIAFLVFSVLDKIVHIILLKTKCFDCLGFPVPT